ncbi:NAD-glutamate dehydrogenase domain-containing protein [Arthrobacter sp. 18067]|uniref:NAD-glutamate dehydrogenase domain-containing protein n=1 Tax=Arthrobacter sp. 18067 TaxID=2681413 RepID=UPI0034DCC7BD
MEGARYPPYTGDFGARIKSSTETHAHAGVRANDEIRVSGNQIRTRVMVAGANLGETQSGRVEAVPREQFRSVVRPSGRSGPGAAGLARWGMPCALLQDAWECSSMCNTDIGNHHQMRNLSCFCVK